jgi:biotin/methionine sulfoxide reductase
LAGTVISDAMGPGVIQPSTGAWYDPLDPADVNAMCVHGKPNALTCDAGTLKLAQGCGGQNALVEVQRWVGTLPPNKAYDPPLMEPCG